MIEGGSQTGISGDRSDMTRGTPPPSRLNVKTGSSLAVPSMRSWSCVSLANALRLQAEVKMLRVVWKGRPNPGEPG